MRQWGLAVISMGGVGIMASQLQENATTLIIAGASLVVVGIIMFCKGKKED